MTTTERILEAGTLPMVPQRELARELGLSVPGLMQRMLAFATDPEVQAAHPELCAAGYSASRRCSSSTVGGASGLTNLRPSASAASANC